MTGETVKYISYNDPMFILFESGNVAVMSYNSEYGLFRNKTSLTASDLSFIVYQIENETGVVVTGELKEQLEAAELFDKLHELKHHILLKLRLEYGIRCANWYDIEKFVGEAVNPFVEIDRITDQILEKIEGDESNPKPIRGPRRERPVMTDNNDE